jgi:hypothetical protein
MHAFANEAMRLFEPIVNVARWNWRGRRIHSRLRIAGRVVVWCLIRAWTGMITALHDSRSRIAARVIDRHRHFILDCHRAGSPHCADDARLETRPSHVAEQ